MQMSSCFELVICIRNNLECAFGLCTRTRDGWPWHGMATAEKDEDAYTGKHSAAFQPLLTKLMVMISEFTNSRYAGACGYSPVAAF